MADQEDLDVARLHGELGKKSSFIKAAQEIRAYVAGRYISNGVPLTNRDSLWPLVERASTLLKTRYTGDHYWRNGQQLFRACEVIAWMRSIKSPCSIKDLGLLKPCQSEPRIPQNARSPFSRCPLARQRLVSNFAALPRRRLLRTTIARPSCR